MWRIVWLLVVWSCLAEVSLPAAEWVRAGVNTNQPVWGIRGGLLWGIPAAGSRPAGGPRGLIRLYYPIATNAGCRLINFIAVEPIVKGRRAFSELEPSQQDHVPGKRLWAIGETNNDASGARPGLTPGQLSHPAPGEEELEVTVRVETFDNGAQVRLVVAQTSVAPDEIRLTVEADAASVPLDYCVLTATMGNLARTRLLWLRDEVLSSLKLYPEHRGDGFAPHRLYPLDRLARSTSGAALVAVTTDEADPASVFPFPGTARWRYAGAKVTQYWKQTRDRVRADLQVAVNARSTYWQTSRPIPGGVAFENFEFRERYYQGQQFVFGITRQTPTQLGIGAP